MVISTPAARADAMVAALKKRGALVQAVIGQVVGEHPGRIVVK